MELHRILLLHSLGVLNPPFNLKVANAGSPTTHVQLQFIRKVKALSCANGKCKLWTSVKNTKTAVKGTLVKNMVCAKAEIHNCIDAIDVTRYTHVYS